MTEIIKSRYQHTPDAVPVAQYRNLIRKSKQAPDSRVIAKKPKRGKYNNTIIHDEVYGKFDSKKEYEEWKRLLALSKTGAIQDLQRQVKFPLDIGRVHITNYYADFVYCFRGERVVHDVKGKRTDVYKIKYKLMKAIHGITIKET